jgi:quercetin dioxygenase-like cupin family protein
MLLVAVNAAAGQTPAERANTTSTAVVALPGELEWSPAPAILPPGARLAVVEGDPGAQGEFTMRLWMPANYRIPPHFHPATEHVTVIQGTFHVGMGEKFDVKQGHRLPTGSFGALPAGMRHFAWTEGETIIQLHGIGPWGLSYVNPADDPSRKTK